jgi:hypothetical protein
VRYAAPAAALALLAACGGDPKDPAPTPAQSTPAISLEAKAVRDAVAATLAGCPCEVTVHLGAFSEARSFSIQLRGVYDPKTQSTELKEVSDGVETGIVLRIVDGRTYLDPDVGKWVELDFSGVPAKPVSPLYPVAIADPRIAFALASNVSVATPAGVRHEVEYDLAAAGPATGPWAAMMKRLVPGASVYDSLKVENGRLVEMSFRTTDSGNDDDMNLRLVVDATGRAAPNVAVPTVERTVDVAHEEIAP